MTNQSDAFKAKAGIVDLSEYREHKAARAGYRLWRLCFKEEFGRGTRIMDLGPAVLLHLADSGSDALFYSLILGFMGFSEEEQFESLERRAQMHVMDVHFFLADQMRFEMMRRLGWIEGVWAVELSLFELVRDFEQCKARLQECPPLLVPDHPGHAAYAAMVDRDKQVFIRRLFPEAFEAFGRCPDTSK